MKTPYPRATTAIACVTALAYFLVAASGQEDRAVLIGGFLPARVVDLYVPGTLPAWLTPLSATFLHAGLLHLGMNLLTLIFCGKEDEVALGPWGIALLYLVGAYAAAAAEYLAFPHSMVPMIGASGAISSLVGAYAILYGRRRESKLPPAIARWLHVLWLAAAWVGLQILIGIASAASGMGIATAAHVGGFLVGVLLARPILAWRYRKA